MPTKKVQIEATDWELLCPACNRNLGHQKQHVVEIRDPHFKCRFCDAHGTAIWDNLGRNRLVRG